MSATATQAVHSDPGYLAKLRHDLVRFAHLQLRDAGAAEDAVQEALAAAWANADRYAGQAEHRTWVFGILRHKLIDTLRARKRTMNLSELDAELTHEALLDTLLFDANGHWAAHAKPHRWPTPESALARQQFWQLFEACLDRLPERIGRVFMMREFLDLEIDEICAELSVNTNHCSVLMYRARMKLRTCLSERGVDCEDLDA